MTKILVVCSFNKGQISPFIREQVESLKVLGHEIDYFKIKGKGVFGYLKNLPKLKKVIKKNNYNLIHAHFGLSGLLANLQLKVPVVTTFHGTDTFTFPNKILSLLCSRLSAYNILTHEVQISQLRLRNKYDVIPCGIDTDIFKPMDKSHCRKKLKWNPNKKYVLFSSSFNRPEKNAELAFEVINRISSMEVELIELKGYKKKQVPYLINASDAVLITSKYETGPLIAKEALACNTPVISTCVGNLDQLKELSKSINLVSYDSAEIAKTLINVLSNYTPHESSSLMEQFRLEYVASKILKIYEIVASEDTY